MSDGMLSQEEIEALISGMAPANKPEAKVLRTEDYLDAFAIDTLGELGNISFGSSATALSSLLGQKVEITTPSISIIDRADLEKEFPKPYVAIQVEYTQGLSGENLLVIQQSDAAIIADLMLGGDGEDAGAEELNEIHLSAIQEAMNQMMGSAATSMSTMFNKKVDISPPTIELLNVKEDTGTDTLPEDHLLVKISFSLKVGNLIDSSIMQLLPLSLSKSIISSLTGETDTEETPSPSAETTSAGSQPPHAAGGGPRNLPPQTETRPKKEEVPVQRAQFMPFEPSKLSAPESNNLNMLLDIPLQVTVELGRTKRSVKEILELTGGSIIELDKLAGEPVDVLVNNRLVAQGEVVVIDENFGVRITDISSQADRLNKLK
ncbi:flagellar motor switch phosphatase FliY [Indiicoccus explosivorum]|uniref:flagellar motor switch phosphatase FliY n=1 Tax=Indiicoccus explosivorum TaxID=1917864 RepID=UPI000B44C2AE|nr:flagellar motor switch phosphatase FliY [Indiicoccus explosivorum]